MKTLLMRLAGPMQSWGVQDRFTHRHTGLEPSKSGVIGMLCAAMGWPRHQEHFQGYRLEDLSNLFFGVRVDREGLLEMDFQTATGVIRAASKAVKEDEPETVVSLRYYLADANFLVGLQGENDNLLNLLDSALYFPKWPLYLGRKAYVPGSPMRIGLADLGLKDVFHSYPWIARNSREKTRMIRKVEEDCEAGRPPQLRIVLDAPFGSTHEERPDVPLSFAGRRFGKRCVETGFMPLTREMIQEDDHVSLPLAS
jgi:CRISPR system Cascade subunit CasD